MEDTLRVKVKGVNLNPKDVLILVLMEDTLRGLDVFDTEIAGGLNPCFNGRYSQRQLNLICIYNHIVLILVLMEDTLRVPITLAVAVALYVLILVLMEDTLRGIQSNARYIFYTRVLILVLMEDTLRGTEPSPNHSPFSVLILVLMEDTLRVVDSRDYTTHTVVS